MRILLIEDSSRLRQGIAKAFRCSGYAVDTAADGEEGLWLSQSNSYDAIILDIMLPKLDGLTLLKRVRENRQQTPILLLTAKDTVPDRVIGLRTGADDYLTKPFALEELLARMEALCRRAYRSSTNTVSIGPLSIDFATRRVQIHGEELKLTHREFRLIEYLARRQGAIVSRTDIESHIYDEHVDPMSNVVDATVYILRKKLNKANCPPLIHTRRGLGYIIEFLPTH